MRAKRRLLCLGLQGSFKELERVIHACVSSRLDYCNSLYMGISQSNINRLQMVQNAAARLLTGTCRFDHISPVLCSLHWLPVCYRIEFNTLQFVFKALSGTAPEYLSDLLNPNTSSRPLRASEKRVSMGSRSRLKVRGDRAFSIAGPTLVNSLPPISFFRI